MTDFNTIFTLILIWVQSPTGTNTLAALIVCAGLLNIPARLCLLLTLALHVAVIVAL